MPDFLFSTPSSNGATDFYSTDGTAAGTQDLDLDRFPYQLPSGGLDPVFFNGGTAFLGTSTTGPSGSDTSGVVVLTNGTAAATTETPIAGVGGPGYPRTLAVVGTYLVASGNTYTGVAGIWSSSDGQNFTEIAQHVQVNRAVGVAVSNGVGFFQGIGDSSGNEGLWRTDGTSAGTVQVSASVDPLAIAAVTGGAVFFSQATGGAISLMFSDGASALNTISTGSLGSFTDSRPVLAASAGGKAFVSGIDTAGDFAIFATDGTDAGTTEVYQGGTASGSTRNPVALVPIGNRMLISTGYSVFASDGTAAGTVGLTNGLPGDLVSFGSKALIYVTEDQAQPTLYATDGTTAGTQVLTIPGLAANGTLSDFTAVGSQVVFVGTDTSGKTAFFVTDGTSAGSHELSLPAGVTLNPSSLPDILPLAAAPPAGQVVALGAGDQNYAASPGDTVFAGAGNTTVTASSGGAEVVANAGNLLFVGGTSQSTVAGGTGSDTIFGGLGGGNYAGGSAGGNVLISQGASGANTTLTGGGAGDRLFGSAAGHDVLIAATGRETLVGGGGPTTVDGGGTAACVIFAGSGTTDYFGGVAGGDTVVGGTGALNATLNKGDALFAAGGSTVVTGSTSGADSVIGGAGSLSVNGQGGNMLVVAGTGNNTISTGNGASLIFGRTGASTVIGGSGSMEVITGPGNMTINEGSGPALYDVINGQGGGSDMISGFKPGTDRVNLFGYQPSQVSQTVSGGSTVLSLSDGTRIELLGVTDPGGSIIG